MKMYKTIPMFILLFTGYLCTNMVVAEETTLPSYSFSTTSPVREDPESETATPADDPIPETRLSAPLVAGICISLVLIFITVAAGVWYARKKSKRSLAESSVAHYSESGRVVA
ncbi:uncharacterized protein FYN12_002931 isoform 2-T2 [Phoenicopterus ruber ruber]